MKHNQSVAKQAVRTTLGLVLSFQSLIGFDFDQAAASTDPRQPVHSQNHPLFEQAKRIGQVVGIQQQTHPVSGQTLPAILSGNVVLAGDGCHAVVPQHSVLMTWNKDPRDPTGLRLITGLRRRRLKVGEQFEVRFGNGIEGTKHSIRTVGSVVTMGHFVPAKEGQPARIDGLAGDWVILRLSECIGDQLGYFHIPKDDGTSHQALNTIGDLPTRTSETGVMSQKCNSKGWLSQIIAAYFATDCRSTPGWSGAAVVPESNPNELFGISVGVDADDNDRRIDDSAHVIHVSRFRAALELAMETDPRNQARQMMTQQASDGATNVARSAAKSAPSVQ